MPGPGKLLAGPSRGHGKGSLTHGAQSALWGRAGRSSPSHQAPARVLLSCKVPFHQLDFHAEKCKFHVWWKAVNERSSAATLVNSSLIP